MSGAKRGTVMGSLGQNVALKWCNGISAAREAQHEKTMQMQWGDLIRRCIDMGT